MENKFQTGLIAGAIGLAAVAIPLVAVVANRPTGKQKEEARAIAPPVGRAEVEARTGSHPGPHSSKSDYPYPECEFCVQWLKENIGDPASLEIIQWIDRKEFVHGPAVYEKRGGQKVLARYDSNGPMEHELTIKVKFRAKNTVGAMMVDRRLFHFSEGKFTSAGPSTPDDYPL